MKVEVQFWSYFKEITNQAEMEEALPEGGTVGDLLEQVFRRFPKLKEMERAMLVAVGLEYQRRDYVLHEGDRVSLFPPVQGG